MLKKLQHRWEQFLQRFAGTEVAGVELFVHSDGQLDIHLVVLQKEKEELNFVTKHLFLDSIENLKNHIDCTLPVVLVLNGKGILHRQLEELPEDLELLPQAILPNAKTEDFCFQVIKQSSDYWISLGRKMEVERWVKTLGELELQVVAVQFGSFASRFLQPMIEGQTNSLNTGYFSLTFDDGNIQQHQKNAMAAPTNLFLGEEPLPNLLLIAAGSGFQHLMQIPHTFYQSELTEIAAEDYQYNHAFKYLGWRLLMATFAVLLLNFLVFSWSHSKTQEQENQLVYHQRQLNQLDTLQRELSQKQDFFKDNKLLESSNVSFYGDAIGASLPLGIQLTELLIFPDQANQQQQREKVFLFDKNTITIKGNSQKSTILNEWIKVLKAMEWVAEVKVLPYAETKGGLGEFELEIIVKLE